MVIDKKANPAAGNTPEMLYDAMKCNYPKFYKMDSLCKWAWVAAEALFYEKDLYLSIDKSRIALVLMTSHGCIDVDKRYLGGITVPSPALFVYTLPNIMLGEICIRHGFKGEQVCLVNEHFDTDELFFTVNDIMKKGMDACLCGWVDVAGDEYDICMYWVKPHGHGATFSPAGLQEIYEQH